MNRTQNLQSSLYAAEVKVESTENEGQILIAVVSRGGGGGGRVHLIELKYLELHSLSLLIL